MKVCFVDCETTGLDPKLGHDIWELAMIVRQPGEAAVEWQAVLWCDVSKADATALRMNRFYERYVEPRTDLMDVALGVAKLLDGAILVGANVQFDAAFIDSFLRKHGAAPSWHYRLLDIEAYAAGRLGKRAPYDPRELSELLGVPRPESEHHTAMGDARWALRMYDAVLEHARLGGRAAADPPPDRREPPPEVATPEAPDAPTAPEADPEPEGEPAVVPSGPQRKERPSRTEPSECEECKTEVPPEDANLSYSRFRKVLCRSGEGGGCFGRMVPASA